MTRVQNGNITVEYMSFASRLFSGNFLYLILRPYAYHGSDQMTLHSFLLVGSNHLDLTSAVNEQVHIYEFCYHLNALFYQVILCRDVIGEHLPRNKSHRPNPGVISRSRFAVCKSSALVTRGYLHQPQVFTPCRCCLRSGCVPCLVHVACPINPTCRLAFLIFIYFFFHVLQSCPYMIIPDHQFTLFRDYTSFC